MNLRILSGFMNFKVLQIVESNSIFLYRYFDFNEKFYLHETHRKENCVKYFRKFVDSKFGKPSNEWIIYPITVDTVDFIVWTVGKVSGTQLMFAFDASKTFFVVGSRLRNSFFGVKDHALASKNKNKYLC